MSQVNQLHRAIIGGTGSGKTFSGQQSARRVRALGRSTLVLHLDMEPWPRECASWQTSDPDEFIRMYWAARNCDAFMELADADVDKFDDRFHKAFTRGRHWGHRNYFLSQYGPTVHPIIRANCTSLCLFAVNNMVAKAWSLEFNDPALLEAAKLPPRWFYFKADRFTPVRLMQVSTS